MKILPTLLLTGFMLASASVARADNAMTPKDILFKKGTSGTSVKGQIKGHDTQDYRVRANAGQTMVIDLKANKGAAYFNLLPPKSEQALFIGSASGYHFKGVLPSDGVYTVRVYLMGGAKDSQQAVGYTLKIHIANTKKSTTAQHRR